MANLHFSRLAWSELKTLGCGRSLLEEPTVMKYWVNANKIIALGSSDGDALVQNKLCNAAGLPIGTEIQVTMQQSKTNPPYQVNVGDSIFF
eukprot:1613405-Amphidinium_carterae.2